MSLLATQTRFLPAASFWEPLAEARFEFHRPCERPDLWEEYLLGALASYRRYGVEEVLELPLIQDGATTSLFIAALDISGRVVAGARFEGPLRSSTEAHLVVEWSGSPGELAVRRLLEERIPYGVIEARAAWVDDRADLREELTQALARCAIHGMDLLHVRFACCSSALHALRRWQSSGAKPIDGIPTVPYPDERYETGLLWWDRRTICHDADAEQWWRLKFERGRVLGVQLPGGG